jgi:hypothetical protein
MDFKNRIEKVIGDFDTFIEFVESENNIIFKN